MKGTTANLVIKQGAEQHYAPELFIEANTNDAGYKIQLQQAFEKLKKNIRDLNCSSWQMDGRSLFR